MNFSGKYQVQSQENLEAFLKAVGECWATAGGHGHDGLVLHVVALWGPDVWMGGAAVQALHRPGVLFCYFRSSCYSSLHNAMP